MKALKRRQLCKTNEYTKHISLSECDHVGVHADPITNLGEIPIVSLISYLQFVVIPIYCYIMYSAIFSFVSPAVSHEPSGISSTIGADVLNDSLTPLRQGSPGDSYDDSLSSDKSYQSETNETNRTSGKIRLLRDVRRMECKYNTVTLRSIRIYIETYYITL